MATVRKTFSVADRHNAVVKPPIKTVWAALIEAESSGTPQPFDSEAFKSRMQKMHAR